MRRTDPLEELLSLRFGIRIDQPGRIERDFQTARQENKGKVTSLPLTERYFLTDATFVAAVEGDDSLITALNDAVKDPVFPLYLGRRAFPPAGPLTLGVRESDVWTALTNVEETPWQASNWWKRKQHSEVNLEIRIDADAVPIESRSGAITLATQSDAPISFDPTLRQYGIRRVAQTSVRVPGLTNTRQGHDPMALLGGA
jgi:CRISPR system Cascade subunit CasD